MKKLLLSTAALAAFCSSAAQANTVFTDRAAFEAALTSFFTESFENNPQFDAVVTYGDLTIEETNGINSITNSLISVFFTNAVTDGSGSVWYDDNDDSIANFSFANPINAVGFDIATSASETASIVGPGFTESISVGTSPVFFGIIATSMFTSFTVDVSGGPEVGFDRVSYGMGTAATVPIPAAAPLMLAGLGALGLRRRRKAQ
ncbi:MAG: VPLPA-CTERM sorting domain-containing protein [Pseudomonadota bacterium]